MPEPQATGYPNLTTEKLGHPVLTQPLQQSPHTERVRVKERERVTEKEHHNNHNKRRDSSTHKCRAHEQPSAALHVGGDESHAADCWRGW